MTLGEIYFIAKNTLKEAQIESYSFDTFEIFKKVFKINKCDLILNKNQEVSCDTQSKFMSLIGQRAKRHPLQYIIGEWTFMGMEFEVGDGVLIPREETELLVRECIGRLNGNKNPLIVDLCSGSGAIAISIGKSLKDSTVYAVEVSNTAYKFLRSNIDKHGLKNVQSLNKSMFDLRMTKIFKNVDLIVSNPPYIPSSHIGGLQKEVLMEPRIALDGGKDGLDFYRFIIKHWTKCLKLGGYLCVEMGINQAQSIKNIFTQNELISTIEISKDMNGIDRVLVAKT